MKFLCPSCKAKYQIADEKVAGRSVRMKCRKCGFMIQVSSALAAPPGDSDPPDAGDGENLSVPPGAVVQDPPPKSAPKAAPSPALPPVAPVTRAAAAPKGPAAPAPRPPPGKPTAAAPKPAGPPPRATVPRAATATSPAAPAPSAAATAPAAAPAPSATAASPAPTPVAVPPTAGVAKPSPAVTKSSATKSSPLAALPAPKPSPLAAAPAPAPAPKAVEAPAKVELPRDFEDAEEEVTRMADAGALAGAFSKAFSGRPDAPTANDSQLSMPADEWFVGINGVPVGPIRLSELRSKAASGAVTKESLVWRDGFEDWRPLKTYPELLAIVEEGVSSARASLTPFMPLSVDSAKALAAQASAAAAASAEDPFARAPSPSAVTGSAVVTDEIAGLIPPRRGTSPMVWVAMVIAIGLGLTLGFVIFGGQKPGETRVVEKIVEKEVPAKDVAAPAANNAPGEAIAADPQTPKKVSGTPKAQATAAATPGTESKPLPGLSGLNGLSNLGPSSGPATGGPSGATGGGAQLEGSQIQATVARYTGSVKRRCWQPALDARAKDAPMTAKVTVTITVGPSGSVQSATVGGEPKGYPGLASCISQSVRSWTFPASGGTTIANVPFVFAGQ